MGHRLPVRALILGGAPYVAALLGIGTFWLTVGPPARDNAAVLPTFLGLALATSATTFVLPRCKLRKRAVQRAVLLVAVAGMLTAVLAVTVAGLLLMLSPPELRMPAIFLFFGSALGVILELAMIGSLTTDLRVLRGTARRISGGDLAARADLDRLDEVGQAARAIDSMASQLQAVEDERASVKQAREAFLSAVGHDLRTPLAALRASVEALQDGLTPDVERAHAAMHGSLDAMSGLVEDLFLLARLEAGSLEFTRMAVDLAELSDEAVETLAPVAMRRGVRLRLQTEGQVLTVGGPAELSRAVRNLLDNAIRHTAPHSEVVLEVANADGALVRVVDQGPGFPEGMRERLFDGFMRAAAAEGRTMGGSGFGLTIAKGLVEAHGGRIWVEDGPGGRVAFRVPGANPPLP